MEKGEGPSKRQLARQAQLLDWLESPVEYNGRFIDTGKRLLNPTEVRSPLAGQERTGLFLPTQVVLAQLGGQFLETADPRLDDTQLHGISPRGHGNEGKQCRRLLLILVKGAQHGQ